LTSDTSGTPPDSLKLKRLEEENYRLRRAVDELAILNDLSLAISGSLDSEKIMRSIIGKSIRALNAEQGDINLVGEDSANHAHTLVRSMVTSTGHSPLHLNQNLLGWMQINKKPLMINEPGNDDRFRNVAWESSIRSVLSAPLMVRTRLIGILTVYNKGKDAGELFTESDQRLLSIIASQSAQVVENARLYEEEQALQFVRREMELAASIQRKLIPGTSPELPGYLISGRNLTAQTVGGDYFDFIRLDNHRLAICLGDISGKGLPASLLMSNLQAILRGHAAHFDHPGHILRSANHQLYESTSPEKFATLFLGILDTTSHSLHYSSGGHEHPFLLRGDGNLLRLQAGGLPLGMMDDQQYPDDKVEFYPGDCMVIFSDGITDNVDGDLEMYGEERLEKEILSIHGGLETPVNIIDRLFNASIRHGGTSGLFDDMTAIVLTRTES
jgi:phosphoserine phosphatase RsbU/P